MASNFATSLMAIVALLGAAAGIYAFVSRSTYLLEKWADENRFRLLHAEHRMFRKGPFLWSGRGQTVYRVGVQDERGFERRGWVRCGSWWLGLITDQVEVKWDA